jgi:putrescine transport system ATP-binding protein
MRIAAAAPPAGTDNCIAGTIVDVGYLGDSTVYQARIADGSIVKAAVANSGRAGERATSWDERVWLSFIPEAAIVLTR